MLYAPHEEIQRLRRILAWDRTVTPEIAGDGHGLHIRHHRTGYLCEREPSGLTSPATWEGPLCARCAAAAPQYVHPRVLRPARTGGSLAGLCAAYGVELLPVPREELPEPGPMGGAASGAVMLGAVGSRRRALYVVGRRGRISETATLSALHEIAHVLTEPYGLEDETACGHYAVQYALAARLSGDLGARLMARTLDAPAVSSPIGLAVAQARAWSLGLLDGSCMTPE